MVDPERQLNPTDDGIGVGSDLYPGPYVQSGNGGADGQRQPPGAPPLAPPVDIAGALRNLKSRCKRRCRPGEYVMSPMDENMYFDTPTETLFQPLPHPVIIPVASANPMRVGLMFSCTEQDVCVVTTVNPPALNGAGNGQGLTVGCNGGAGSFGVNPVVLLQRDFGPLVTMAWFAFLNSGALGSLTVWEIVLREWPQQANYADSATIYAGEPEQSGIVTAKAGFKRPIIRRGIRPIHTGRGIR